MRPRDADRKAVDPPSLSNWQCTACALGPPSSIPGSRRQLGDIHAVHAVEFDVHPDETFRVPGPDGSGEATAITVNVLCGAPYTPWLMIELPALLWPVFRRLSPIFGLAPIQANPPNIGDSGVAGDRVTTVLAALGFYISATLGLLHNAEAVAREPLHAVHV